MNSNVEVLPVLVWEQSKVEEQSTNVIPLFGDKENHEESIQKVILRTEQHPVEITLISSGFGKVSSQHGTISNLAA